MGIAAFLLRDQMPFLAEGYAGVLAANTTGLVLAFIAVLFSIFAMADVMRVLLNAGEDNDAIKLNQTSRLTLVANAWSSTFPGGVVISTVYQFHTMRNWGVSVVVSSWFIVVSAALSTVWLIALGLISVFFLGASFSVVPLVGSAVILVGMAFLVWWITQNPEPTTTFLVAVLDKLGSWGKRPKEAVAKHLSQLDVVNLSPGKFAWVAFLSLMNWVFDIMCLWLCVWAVTDVLPTFDRVENHTTLLGVTLAFVTAKIVGTAQVTPAGIGPVEAAMTGSLVAVGMTVSSAFGVVLVYRIISFVLVTLLGWLIYFIDTARGGIKATASPKTAEESATQQR